LKFHPRFALGSTAEKAGWLSSNLASAKCFQFDVPTRTVVRDPLDLFSQLCDGRCEEVGC
jgi:hypothetical protein